MILGGLDLNLQDARKNKKINKAAKGFEQR
jgi:hypothetical protein